MRRRTFLTASLSGLTLSSAAFAQGAGGPVAATPAMIEPQNALEYAFVSALSNEGMRAVFRRYLLDTHVALALADEADETPLEVDVRQDFRACAMFTSAVRAQSVLGADAPYLMINGRAALERLRGKNVVINYRLRPMLTLEPEDVARYLETPGSSSAGPSQ